MQCHYSICVPFDVIETGIDAPAFQHAIDAEVAGVVVGEGDEVNPARTHIDALACERGAVSAVP